MKKNKIFLKVLTRCQYRICIADKKQIAKKFIKYGKYKKIFEGIDEMLPMYVDNEYDFSKSLDNKLIFTTHALFMRLTLYTIIHLLLI